MKKLISIFAVFFSLFGSTQPIYVRVLDQKTGLESWIPYVYSTSITATGVPQKYVDSLSMILQNQILAYRISVNGKYGNIILSKNDVALNNVDNTSDISKPVSSAVQNALNNKADKGTTGGIGLPYGNIINLPPDTYINEVRPVDYGVTFTNGIQQQAWFTSGYEHATGINYHSNSSDNVFQIAAYNMTPKGNRISLLDGGWTSRVETNYDISTQFLNSFEPHIWGYMNRYGQSMRSLSGYFSKDTLADGSSYGFWSTESNYFMFSNPAKRGGLPMNYAKISEGAMNVATTQPGRILGFIGTAYDGINVGMYQIGGQGFLQVPGIIKAVAGYSNNGGHVTFYLPTVPTGLVSGESYWKTITVGGESFDVITRVK